MSISFLLTPCNSFPQRHKGVAFLTPRAPLVSAAPPRLSNLPPVRSLQGQGHQPLTPAKPRWENLLATAASLYPLYVTFGGAVACFRPSTFSWFVNKAPLSYSFSLGFIMLAMGLTLELRDLFDLLMQRPLSVSFYTIHVHVLCLFWFARSFDFVNMAKFCNLHRFLILSWKFLVSPTTRP